MAQDKVDTLSPTCKLDAAGEMPKHATLEKHQRKQSDGEDGEPSAKKRRKKPNLAEELNALPSEEFKLFIPQMMLEVPSAKAAGPSFTISHKRSDCMSQSDFDECFSLIKGTSMQDYLSSSIGWNPKHKRREMADDDMHYLLVRATSHGSDSDPQPSKTDSAKNFAGFVSFMITTDSVPEVPLIYIYEIHLAASSRGRGLGKHLMSLVSQVAVRAGLRMLMLTCFTCNGHARQFYERYGFSIDPTSPEDRRTRGKVIKSDHIIMSKRLDMEKG